MGWRPRRAPGTGRHRGVVILADTSAWIEYLRGTGSSVDLRLDQLLRDDAGLAVTEVVAMELLAARRTNRQRRDLRRLIYRLALLPVGGIVTYEVAAMIHRACRARGETIRKMTDCLIAAVAIREGAEVLHHDRDFDAIARHTPLRLAQ